MAVERVRKRAAALLTRAWQSTGLGLCRASKPLDLIQKCVLQLAHKIYEKPMSLPEFVLERGRSSAGDARRLRDMFLRLDAGVLCSPVKWPLVRTMRI